MTLRLKKINLEFNFLICADICIPESASLTLDLSLATPNLLLSEAVTELPTNFLQTNSSKDQENLKVTFQSSEEITSAYLFPKQDNLFIYSASQKLVKLNDDTYEITVPLLSSDITFFSGILSLNGEGFQVEENLQSVSSMSLWQAISICLNWWANIELDALRFPSDFFKSIEFCLYGWRRSCKN